MSARNARQSHSATTGRFGTATRARYTLPRPTPVRDTRLESAVTEPMTPERRYLIADGIARDCGWPGVIEMRAVNRRIPRCSPIA